MSQTKRPTLAVRLLPLGVGGPLLVLLALAACGREPGLDAGQIAYQDGTVAGTLEMLVAAENRRAQREEQAGISVSVERVAALEQRIVELELQIARIQTTGVLPASTIGFDPRATTLSGQDVQSALSELHGRVKLLEEKGEAGMGQPGPGFFTKVQPGGMQQGGMQPGGMQPGGMQQGGMQQGGMQPGGMQQGGMQPGGMQPGGMQQGGMQQGGMQQGGMQQGGMQQGGMQQGGQRGGQGSSGR